MLSQIELIQCIFFTITTILLLVSLLITGIIDDLNNYRDYRLYLNSNHDQLKCLTFRGYVKCKRLYTKNYFINLNKELKEDEKKNNA